VTSARGFFMHRIIATLLLTAIRSFSSGMGGTTEARNSKAALVATSTTVSLQLTGEKHEASDPETETEPTRQAVAPRVPPDTSIYFYPVQGHAAASPEQQDRDEYECNTWANPQVRV
jgi:hypothetical protein